jgi:hypothetical protein
LCLCDVTPDSSTISYRTCEHPGTAGERGQQSCVLQGGEGGVAARRLSLGGVVDSEVRSIERGVAEDCHQQPAKNAARSFGGKQRAQSVQRRCVLPVDRHCDLHLLRQRCNRTPQRAAAAAADEPVGRLMQAGDASKAFACCCLGTKHNAAIDECVQQGSGKSVVNFKSQVTKHVRHLEQRCVLHRPRLDHRLHDIERKRATQRSTANERPGKGTRGWRKRG